MYYYESCPEGGVEWGWGPKKYERGTKGTNFELVLPLREAFFASLIIIGKII
jgi:hypothetical protein